MEEGKGEELREKYKSRNTERNASRDQLVLPGEKLHKSVTLSGIQYEVDEGVVWHVVVDKL